MNRTNRAACRTGQVVPPSLVDEHKAITRSIKSEIRRSNRCAHSTYIRSAASAKVRASLIWKRSQRYSTGQTKTFGDRCTYKGIAYSGTPDVAATLTQKMRDTHTHVPGNPAYDQAFHDYIASTIPHLLSHDPTPHATMASLFTVGDFDKLLLRLSGRDTKSPGPDGVPYWMISRGGGALHAFLLDLYNLMWTCELIPTEWGHCHIRYLHKKKSKLDLSNYRPISLISCLAKAFTMLWLPRLEAALKPHIAPQQGLQGRGSGSNESLWTVTALIDRACSQSPPQHVHALFCDTSLAFDGVWRDGLYFILYSYGVRGKMLRMVKSWHDSATMTGLWYDIEGFTIPYSQGVRQGCVLAPLLYVAMVNPLAAPPPSLTGHLFPLLAAIAFGNGLHGQPGVPLPSLPPNWGKAQRPPSSSPLATFMDDVCLLSLSQQSLQANTDRYSAYCKRWRSKLNWDKFQLVVFGQQLSRTNPPSIVAPGSSQPVEAKKVRQVPWHVAGLPPHLQ